MSIVLQSTGGGSVSIVEPTTASNFTQTLPAVTGTVVVSGTTPSLNGITFPATQVPSADANTLDDYEEGTFSPTTASAGYTISFSNGYYTKIGQVVHIYAQVAFSAVNGSSNSQVNIDGLPFTNTSLLGIPGVARDNSSTGTIYMIHAPQNGSNMILNSMDGISSGSQRTIRVSENYIIQLTYRV